MPREKSKGLSKNRAAEICRLHSEIGDYLRNLRMTLDKAIRIGELLSEEKASRKHGEWLPWVEANLPFSERVARDYMRFFDQREKLKSAKITDLTEARKLLAAPVLDWETAILTLTRAISNIEQINEGFKRGDYLVSDFHFPDGFGDELRRLIKSTDSLEVLQRAREILLRLTQGYGEFNLQALKWIEEHKEVDPGEAGDR